MSQKQFLQRRYDSRGIVRDRKPVLKREQKIGALTLAHPFRWRLRNVGVRG
jgi:hypothetical protein